MKMIVIGKKSHLRVILKILLCTQWKLPWPDRISPVLLMNYEVFWVHRCPIFRHPISGYQLSHKVIRGHPRSSYNTCRLSTSDFNVRLKPDAVSVWLCAGLFAHPRWRAEVKEDLRGRALECTASLITHWRKGAEGAENVGATWRMCKRGEGRVGKRGGMSR